MGLTKMVIEAYSDTSLSTQVGEQFEVMFNPENYKESVNVSYWDNQTPGSSAANPVYEKTRPRIAWFTFVFDGTGAMVPASASKFTEVRDVRDELEKFFECFLFNGDIHRPNYCKLSWGSMIIKCVLESAEVEYTVFDNEGAPLRAKVDAVFKHHIDEDQRIAEENKNSPDLTHYRVVKEGDTLPLMTYNIYGDIAPYQKVAAYNELKCFRKLVPGTRLSFPPLVDLQEK